MTARRRPGFRHLVVFLAPSGAPWLSVHGRSKNIRIREVGMVGHEKDDDLYRVVLNDEEQ